MTLLVIYLGLLVGVMANTDHEKEDLDIKGLTGRSPESGYVELNGVMKCFVDGEVPKKLQWVMISEDEDGEEKEEAIVSDESSEIKAVKDDVTYRCKLDDDNYADFKVDAKKLPPGPEFQVKKFPESMSVVEQDDLKVECKLNKLNTSDLNLAKDLKIKWYSYKHQGDDQTYVAHIGNCSENKQANLHWVEIIQDTSGEEPHINLYDGPEDGQTMDSKLLIINDANRTQDRRAFKCVAYLATNRSECSESAFFVRVRDKYAALWPFLGIVSEVVVICFIIFICERRRAANAKDEMDDEDDDAQNGKRAK